jgi:pyruvyltransferase
MIKNIYHFGKKSLSNLNSIKRLSISTIKKNYYENGVLTYWWDKKKNFGDLVTPYLLNHYGIKPIHTPIDGAELISTGSIIQRASEKKFKGIILGSGIIKDEKRIFPNATIIAVRGKLTADRINAPSNVIIGDPGILISDLIVSKNTNDFKIGIIPHFQDLDDERISKFIERYISEVLLIDVRNNPIHVADQINKCEYIISSSLHGLITADSLNIPNLRFKLNKRASGGGEFKFSDYNSSINREDMCHLFKGNELINDLIIKTDLQTQHINKNKIEMRIAMEKAKNLLFKI